MQIKHITIALAALGLIGGAFHSEATLAQYQSSVLATPGLISYYEFDGSTANDNFGSHNGTTGGGANYVGGVGGGSALNFTGTSYDNLGVVSAFDFTSGTGSVEMWVRAGWTATTAPDYTKYTLVGNAGAYPDCNYTLGMSADKTSIQFWGSGAWGSLPIPDAGTGWHHMAVVFNANAWTLNWDGVSIWTSTIPWSGLSGLSTQLGSDAASGVNWQGVRWIGDMDEVAFYSSALSTSTIQSQYAAMSAIPEPTTLSLMLAAAGMFYLRARRQTAR